MNASQTRKLRALKEALDLLCEINESMPVRQAAALLSVALREAQHGEADLRDVGHDINAPQAVVSRDLLGLGKLTRSRKPGLGLIQSFEDYTDLRRKPYKLTKKGTEVIQELWGIKL